MKYGKLIAAATFAAGLVATAQAHEGPKLLTTGSGERTAKTAGVSYADVDGVHLFKGSARSASEPASPMLAGARAARTTLSIVIHKTPWRSIRRLRTQGFYAGTAPASRRFTQGFYSGH